MENVHTLLTLMYANEKLMANLYGHFAEQYTGFTSFWSHLENEEHMHAKLVKELVERNQEGKVICKIDMEHMLALYEAVRQLQSLYTLIIKYPGMVTFEEAVRMTATLENSMVEEAKMFVESADDHTTKVLKQLFHSETGAHAQRVIAFAQEYEISLDAIDESVEQLIATLEQKVTEHNDHEKQKELVILSAPVASKLIPVVPKIPQKMPQHFYAKHTEEEMWKKEEYGKEESVVTLLKPDEVAESLTETNDTDSGTNEMTPTFLRKLIHILNSPIHELVRFESKPTLEALQKQNRELRDEIATLKKTLKIVSQEDFEKY